MSSATKTTDHDEIRKWAEDRGGKPAVVADTADNGRGPTPLSPYPLGGVWDP